ncbi:MAG: DeoR/GlpR transcriptional regulator [Candidatus Hydrogenedentes bacterium]|nr:DeoR/GlpR transcriptional regulator [Candidatus Hydrogenedentota bacterium]
MNPRHAQIVEALAERGEASVRDLAARFGVAEMTIRRDLAELQREGRLQRTHGGAVLSRAGVVEFAFKEKGRERAAEKRAIAACVAGLIRPGMAISLDTGTTTLEVARAVAGMRELTVLTSSLVIASALYAQDGIELVLLGGTVRSGNPDLSGWLTEENLRRFRVDLAILGADGINLDGAFTTDVAVARVSQAMIAGAGAVVLAADSTKFERTAFVQFASWADIDHVATDAGVPARVRRWLDKTAKRVAYAQT